MQLQHSLSSLQKSKEMEIIRKNSKVSLSERGTSWRLSFSLDGKVLLVLISVPALIVVLARSV